GIQVPRLAVLFDVDENCDILFGDEHDLDDVIWMGRQETLQDKCLKAGLQEVRPFNQLGAYIQNMLRGNRKVHYLPPYQSYSEISLQGVLEMARVAISPSPSLIRAVVELRSVKEDEEIEQIERAVEISVDLHPLAIQI